MEALESLVSYGSGVDVTSADALEAACQVVAALYRSPGEGLRDDLYGGRLGAVTDALAVWAGVDAPRAPHSPPAWDRLRAAYVGLFVSRAGGVPAPPYVGLVHDRELLGPRVRRLRAELAGLGIRPRAEWHELPDHLAAVAEAVDLLMEQGRVAAATTLAVNHLVPWFDRFAEAVAQHDESGFYGELTTFLHTVLSEVAP
ncbi:MAG: molecular chaperone TorD family protein [Deinococcales bacterium]